MSNVLDVTDATIEAEILGSQLPVLIDFYADWCGPCKTLSPRIETLAQKYAGSLKVCKIDVDANPTAQQMFRIQAMPTLVLMSDGQIVDVARGALTAAELEEFVAKVSQQPTTGTVESFDAQRLKLSLEIDQVAAIDLRDAKDWERARIPGSVNVPADQLADRLEELRALPVTAVFYDRNGTTAAEAAKSALEAGVEAGILEGGILAWEAELLKVEKGPKN
ncbi:MAG: thioredoxin 1 [Bradymonadia bacterium]|jgi:thioredoxin 1